MRVLPIHTGNFKLDGGAMFGVVPKVIWNKLVPANENNLCNWSMRCLLVEIEDRKILIDTGIGNKQSEKFYGHYDLNGEDSLMGSLSSHGISADQITDVLLTHLHFDHCGGAIIKRDDALIPQFPNAIYHLTESHWNHANNPNDRERASFLPENFLLLKELGLLNFVIEGDMIADCIEIKVFNGHTFGMIAPIIHWGATQLMYMADLIPAAAHIPVNYVMGYDIQPLITMEEKKSLLPWLESEQVWLIFEHDASFCRAQVQQNDRGQFKAINATEDWFD
ncbi:MAG: MBL fold metallo-hydrolase [Bacteroidetes bacterium]|nr:MBL fold metallo-hydrolase [Bacteroidota bacterium]MDA1224055.1 MBL fold metallo-hydrolase [Bacteroidota bacterium]